MVSYLPCRVGFIPHLFTNAAMSTSTEGQVLALRSLRDQTEAVVDLVTLRVDVFFVLLSGDTVVIVPASGFPGVGVLPDLGVDLGDGGAGEEVVAFWNLVRAVLGGGSEGAGDVHGGDDLAL